MHVFAAAVPDAAPPAWATPVAVVVIGALALLTWVLVRRQHRRVERGAKELAAQHGWQYRARDRTLERGGTMASLLRDAVAPTLVTKNPLGRGILRKARHVVTGTHHGVGFTVFSYRYVDIYFTGRGIGWDLKDFHIGLAQMPAALPPLAWTPEGPLTKLVRVVGVRDIQFESPDFNRAWHVSSGDTRLAYGVFTPQYLEWIMRQEAVPFMFRLDGAQAVAVHAGLAAPQCILPVIEILTGTVAAIPRHVWQDYAPGSAAASGQPPATRAQGLQ